MTQTQEAFATMLDGGVQDAYKRQWHRIERGLRLNRLRLYIDEIAPEHKMTDKEKKSLFVFFQKSLDDKLLNTLKVVQYDPEKQQITGIKGFEIERNADGVLVWKLAAKKIKTESAKPIKTATTRKKKPTL
jgi:hypothetical protein